MNQSQPARQGLAHDLHLVWVLARRQAVAEYKGTFLGRAWSLINPVATILVYTVIFGVVFRGGVEPGINSGVHSFALWIAIGVICWGYFQRVIMAGMNAFVNNAGLLTKVYFSRWVLVLSAAVAETLSFAFELGVLVVLMLIAGGPMVLAYLPALVIVVAITGLFATGLALTLAVGAVYFRDITHFWSIISQVWMYASGVVFPLSMLADAQASLYEKGWRMGDGPLPLVDIFKANPAEQLLECFRSLLYDFALPQPSVWLGALGWTAASLAVGVAVYWRFSDRIVEEL